MNCKNSRLTKILIIAFNAIKKVKYFLKYKPNQTIFDLSNLELRLKFQPKFFYIYCKSSIKNRFRKVLRNYGNHFQKNSVTEVFIKSLVLLCCMNVRFCE